MPAGGLVAITLPLATVELASFVVLGLKPALLSFVTASC